MEDMRTKLEAAGIEPGMIDTLMKSFKPPKEKAEKKKGSWYPGMPSSSNKIEVPVDVHTHCNCCGAVHHQVVTMKIAKNSPTEQHLGCSVCTDCVEFVSSFTHEELVSMILLGEKPNPDLHSAGVRGRGRMAKKMKPMDVILFTNSKDLEVKDASNA